MGYTLRDINIAHHKDERERRSR